MDPVEPRLRDARAVLGVAADARPEEVTRAFRRLARLHHPDVSSSPDAGDRFAAIARAYDVALGRSAQELAPDPEQPPAARPPAPRPFPTGPRRRPLRPEAPLTAGPPVFRPFPREGR